MQKQVGVSSGIQGHGRGDQNLAVLLEDDGYLSGKPKSQSALSHVQSALCVVTVIP
jgi:hypothetical protein